MFALSREHSKTQMSNAIARQSTDLRLPFPHLVLSVFSALPLLGKGQGQRETLFMWTVALMSRPVPGISSTPAWLL